MAASHGQCVGVVGGEVVDVRVVHRVVHRVVCCVVHRFLDRFVDLGGPGDGPEVRRGVGVELARFEDGGLDDGGRRFGVGADTAGHVDVDDLVAAVDVVVLDRDQVVVGVEGVVGVDRGVVVGDGDVVVLDRELVVDAVVLGDRDVVV